MIFTTKKPNSGFFELLIVLPIFVGLLCLIAGLGYVLIAKSKLEKNAWTIQIQKTYRVDTGNTDPYQIEDGSMLQSIFQNLTQLGSVPYVFAGFLGKNLTQNNSLSLQQDFPDIIPILENTTSAQSSENLLTKLKLTSEFSVPGYDFNDSKLLKNGLIDYDMKNAGFDYYLIQLLGYHELAEAGLSLTDVIASLNSTFPGLLDSILPGG